MGVDYCGEYGIGYKVKAGDDIDEDLLEDGLPEYIMERLGDDFRYFEVGEGSYTGDANDVYIEVKDAFSDGLDLTAKKNALDDELRRLKLVSVGDFGDVGGLYVW